MTKIDYKDPHIKFISHKTVTDANGVEHLEKVFTLIPVKAKDKPCLTKEEVQAIKKAKKEAPYVSLGCSNKIPKKPVEKDKDGKIIPISDIWSKQSKDTLKEYRAWKKQHDAETTEIITLPNGFKKKIKIEFDFEPLPSMKLSPEERKTRMDEHKKVSKAKRTVRNARVETFKKNAKPYTPEAYVSNTKIRKEKQTRYWENHNKIINDLIAKLRLRGKKHIYVLTPSKNGEVESNGSYKSIPLDDKVITLNTTSRDIMAKAKEILQNNKEFDGIQIEGNAKNVFLSRMSVAA